MEDRDGQAGNCTKRLRDPRVPPSAVSLWIKITVIESDMPGSHLMYLTVVTPTEYLGAINAYNYKSTNRYSGVYIYKKEEGKRGQKGKDTSAYVMAIVTMHCVGSLPPIQSFFTIHPPEN